VVFFCLGGVGGSGGGLGEVLFLFLFFLVGTMWEVLPVPLALWPHVDSGYLKTAWPDFVGLIFEVWPAPAAPKDVGRFEPHLVEDLLGPPGPTRPQKCIRKFRPHCLQVPRLGGGQPRN
jgi:hypothetical protein